MLRERRYTIPEFLEAITELEIGDQAKKRMIVLNAEYSKEEILKILEDNEFVHTNLGEIELLTAKYSIYGQIEFTVDYYLFQDRESGLFIIFTLDSLSDYYRTLRPIIDSTERMYHFWILPQVIEDVKDFVLSKEGSNITYFHGKKIQLSRRFEKERRPDFSRDIKYEGRDAQDSLEEMKIEYGILPLKLSFSVPPICEFSIYSEGVFVLEWGNFKFLYDEVIRRIMKLSMAANKKIGDSKITINNVNGIDFLRMKKVRFVLEQRIEYDNFNRFLELMKEAGFFTYNATLKRGSIIFSGDVVDSKKGNIFTISTDGTEFDLVPKYDSGYDSLLRFFRFLVENIDFMTKIGDI